VNHNDELSFKKSGRMTLVYGRLAKRGCVIPAVVFVLVDMVDIVVVIVGVVVFTEIAAVVMFGRG